MKNFVDKWEESNKVNTEGLTYIDDGKRKLFYRFTPSKTNPEGAPLLVVLHGHGTRRATRFQREGWNVLSPIDHFGYEGQGAWWLGENGDFFVKDLLQKLIKEIAQKYNSEKNIYIYGSSMGGYGAILHGILCSARAVYANVPQIKLLDTIYSDRSMKRFFAPLFSDNIPIENDLTKILENYENFDQFPVFYLCENSVSGKHAHEDYLTEHTNYFVDKCMEYKIKFHLELLPKQGHDKNYGIGDVVDKFECFTLPITNKIEKNKYNEQVKKMPLSTKEIKSNIIDFIKFEQGLWLFKDMKYLGDIDFSDNELEIKVDLSNSIKAFYVESAFSEIYNILEIEKFEIEVEIDFNVTKVSCFIIEFNQNEERIYSKSYQLKKGLNKFKHTLNSDVKYIKVLFRFDNNQEDTIVLKNLNLNIVNNTIEESLVKCMKKLKILDKKFYLLNVLNTNHPRRLDSYTFKPRKDVDEIKIDLPIDWDMDPFKDNNWKFQLHALRMLDQEIYNYFESQDEHFLKRSIDIVLDWDRDIINNKQNLDFNREKDRNSLAWQDMATGIRAMKITFIFRETIKLENTHPLYKNINKLFTLVNLHIEALSKQKIAAGNHAIFQLHGLMMLLGLFPDNFENISNLRYQTEKKMMDVFYKQFFQEGIHKENSDNYHYLGTNIFENILSEEMYNDIKEVFYVLKEAKKNCAYMHFPNFESLMLGDSDYKIIKKRKEEEIKEGLTYFKQSGYAYIYEENDNPSMLFFHTAFLNRGHCQADFFNVLLYEYGRNILVDAGKYSYDQTNPFRQYCISTRAHNVVLIDNEDYKLDRKYFFTSKLVIKDKKENYYHLMASNYYDYFEVSHDRHIYYKPQEFLLVVDILISKESKNFKQIFHLHQELELVEEDGFFKSNITDNVVMNIKMKSLEMNEKKIYSNITTSKGLDGEIEGYRALGHNEIVENYVLVNEIKNDKVVLGSMFSFHKQRDFNLVSTGESRLEIIFDNCQEIIGE